MTGATPPAGAPPPTGAPPPAGAPPLAIARPATARLATARLATARSRRVVIGLIVALGAAHAIAAGVWYHVGSFDDDSNYILVARALAAGRGLTASLPAGYPLISTYPPGYAALLVPLALFSGSAFLAFRALSLCLLVVLFPLVWLYLGRRHMPDPLRVAVLVLLALNPVLATFGTMIMAEVAFLVALMAVLLAVEVWERQTAIVSWAGAATVVGAAALVWLKEAAAGIVAGLVVWLVVRHLWRKAAATGVGAAVMFSPVLVARRMVGGSLIGSRYSDEFGGAFAGGLVHQIGSVIPHALATYASEALPQSVMPTSVSPLPVVGPVAGALGTLGSTVAPLVVVGLVVWVLRHRDAACVAVPVYLAETLVYPFVNERRLLLVLPLVIAWYVLGAWTVIKALVALSRRLPRAGALVRTAAWAPVAVVVAVLVPQFGRDYLYSLGQRSSTPQGSPYMSLLGRLGAPADVVESDYLWTTNLFSGHRTADSAYLTALSDCSPGAIAGALRFDRAAYLLSGALSAGGVGGRCLLRDVASTPGAVRLLRTRLDDASVFELIGPGTVHASLVDLSAGAALKAAALDRRPERRQVREDPAGTFPTAPVTGGIATFTWTWTAPAVVSQVSVGAAGSSELTGNVTVALQDPDGAWRPMAAVAGAVGGGARTPYLLARLGPAGVTAIAVRVTVRGGGTAAVHDLNVLGTYVSR